MSDRVLITGGAGFIGSRVARRLLSAGYEVSLLDNFSPQIHGSTSELPPDLGKHVRLFRGDVRDGDLCGKALADQDVLIHLAAETGTGQSMYKVRHYSDVNIGGTASLMETLLTGKYGIKSMTVASSRAVYGEGAGSCSEHGVVFPIARKKADMLAGDFEPKCPACAKSTSVIPTVETAPFRPSSLYGLTKQVQEQMVLMYAETMGVNGFALRYQNVYGPWQSLKNPYTGILAIFSNLARTNEQISIFEDGKESRDFVFIDDVVEATVRVVSAGPQSPVALNVGTGRAISVSEVVQEIKKFFGSESLIAVTGSFREGDIRHSCASTQRLQEVLGFVPGREFSSGIKEFLFWAAGQKVEKGGYEHSLSEMRSMGLFHG